MTLVKKKGGGGCERKKKGGKEEEHFLVKKMKDWLIFWCEKQNTSKFGCRNVAFGALGLISCKIFQN